MFCIYLNIQNFKFKMNNLDFYKVKLNDNSSDSDLGEDEFGDEIELNDYN